MISDIVGAPHIAQQQGAKPFSAGECTAHALVWSDAQPRSWEIEANVNDTQKDTQSLPEPSPKTPPPPLEEPDPVAKKIPEPVAEKIPEPVPEKAPVDPPTPLTVPATASQVEAARSTPPPVIPAPSPAITPTEPEEELDDSVSAVPQSAANGGRDPSYWKLRRYFTPKASGELKCTAEAMKLWKTPQGRSWVLILA